MALLMMVLGKPLPFWLLMLMFFGFNDILVAGGFGVCVMYRGGIKAAYGSGKKGITSCILSMTADSRELGWLPTLLSLFN